MLSRLLPREFLITGVLSPMPLSVRRRVQQEWLERRRSWYLWQADLAFCLVFLGGSGCVAWLCTPATGLATFCATILLAFSAFAAIYVPAYRRFCAERFRNSGFCSKCGYDLRFSEARCPECGTPTPSKHAPHP